MLIPTQAPLQVLHTHTVFSVLDGAGTIDQYLKFCKDNGLSACGCTDHGYVLGLYDLITKSNKAKIKPIPGCEFYLAPPPWYNFHGQKPFNFFHLTCWAMNMTGYRNIMSLASKSWAPSRVVKPFGHARPRITWDDLVLHNEGLVVGSGCIEGPIGKPLILGHIDMAQRNAAELFTLFGDRLFFEIMPHRVDRDYYREDLIQVDSTDGITYTFHPDDRLQTDPGVWMTAREACEKQIDQIESMHPETARAQDAPIRSTFAITNPLELRRFDLASIEMLPSEQAEIAVAEADPDRAIIIP